MTSEEQTAYDSLVTTLELYGSLSIAKLIAIEEYHGHSRDHVLDGINWLILERLANVVNGTVELTNDRHAEEIPTGYLQASDNYQKAKGQKPSFLRRLAEKLVPFISVFVLSMSIPIPATEGWRMAELTAYCPCSKCCDTQTNKTADGTNTNNVPYNFAADRSLPFGTKIMVPLGLGVLDNIRKDKRVFTVDDRGGALNTEAKRYDILRLDLRVRDHWWAVKFGRKTIPVFVELSK